MKKSSGVNSDACEVLTKDIEAYKKKITTLQEELNQANDKNISNMTSVAKLKEGNNCCTLWIIYLFYQAHYFIKYDQIVPNCSI